MKYFIVLFATLALLSSCKKGNEHPAVKGKLVYRSCATIVVQVLDSNHHYLAQESWQQESSKPVFKHVFAVANQCSFPGSIGIGQEFTFRVVNSDPKNKDCVLCALFDNPPQKAHLIKVEDIED